jgi:hypothetical protein
VNACSTTAADKPNGVILEIWTGEVSAAVIDAVREVVDSILRDAQNDTP